MRKEWKYLIAPLWLAAMVEPGDAVGSSFDGSLITPVISGRAAALVLMDGDDAEQGASVGIEAVSALTASAEPDQQETVELAALRSWADELGDGEMQGLRGAGYNFNFTASFMLVDGGSPAFDFGASVMPDNVTGAPTMTPTGTGAVQVSTQVANLAGFSGIGTFVTVEGSQNITNTTTNVNILYAPNLSSQATNTTVRSFMGVP